MIDYIVSPCERSDIRSFIEQHHYSKNINGVKSTYCFQLSTITGDLIGAAIFGNLAMFNQWKKYGDVVTDSIELRRLVLVDDTKRNAESYFIGKMLRWLKKNTDLKCVVSYADPNNGHTGVVYRASNFEHVGMSAAGKVIIYNGKQYHDKTIRTKYKGELKPFAARIKQALQDKEAYYKNTVGKHIYLYKLRK